MTSLTFRRLCVVECVSVLHSVSKMRHRQQLLATDLLGSRERYFLRGRNTATSQRAERPFVPRTDTGVVVPPGLEQSHTTG